MGSLFSSNQASQSTTAQQVGAQGGSGTTTAVGAGTSGNTAGGNNATATGALTAYGTGNTINITSSDVDALHLADDVTNNALNVTGQVSVASINAANQNTNEALSAVEDIAHNNATTTNAAVQTAQGIAGQAAPVSEGNIAETLASGGSTSKQIEIGVAVAAVTGLFFYLFKGRKA